MSTARVLRYTTKLLLLALLATLLWLCPSRAVPPAAAAGPYLYVTSYDYNALLVSNLDGTSPINKGDLGGNLNAPTGIAIDVRNQLMYIANWGNNTVVRANLDGTSPTPLSFGPGILSGPMGLALDFANSKIYVANFTNNRIVKANLDGSSAVALDLGPDLVHPWAIALDTYNNYMYVTSNGGGVGKRVIRAKLDGTSPTALNFSVEPQWPSGIALDFYNYRMYVASSSDGVIIRSNLDGSGAVNLGDPGTLLNSPSGLVIDSSNQKLYIASVGNSRVVRTDLNGGNAVNLTAQPGWGGLIGSPYFVALDSPPDLRASLYHNNPGGIPAGGGFDWILAVSNYGPNPAVFTAGQTILRDYLPAGPTYVSATATFVRLTVNGTISCSISSNVLTCTQSSGSASFAPGASSLTVIIKVLTHASGTLTNPSGGVCRADPDHVSGDTTPLNNDCSNSITVYAPNVARPQRMYVVDNWSNSVSRGNLDGSSGVSLGNPGALLNRAYAIALDLAHEKMYVTSTAANHIIRANLDGTGGTDLGNLGGLLNYPSGIALDVADNKMYVTNWNSRRIVRADLNGNGAIVLYDLMSGVSNLSAIALDLVNRQIFVTGLISNTVYRAKMDGSGGGLVFSSMIMYLSQPRGIAIDPLHGKVYVTSYLNDTVMRGDLDGSGADDLGNLGGLCSGPVGIATAPSLGQIYVTCIGWPYRVVRANLDGSNPQNLGNLNGTLYSPFGIALDLGSRVQLPLMVR